MFGPVYSTLAVKATSMTTLEQQKRVNSACQRVGNVPNSASYYSKSWHVISMMTLNGDASKLGPLLRGETSPTPISPPTPAPFTNPPISPPSPPTPPTNSNNCCSFDNKSCSGSAYCNKNQNQCEISCKGFWINAPINVTPVPTVSPTNAPTSKGCYSNNYKNCLPGGSEYASCNNIWLPNGPQDNCVALWEDCTDNGSSCCGPAECFSDGNSASCVPPTDVTPTPTFAPTKTCRAKGEPCQSKKDCCKKKCKKGKCKK